MCDREPSGRGAFDTEEECCERGAAFDQGCEQPLPQTCWIVDEYYPDRTCRETNMPHVCGRGWGTYGNERSCRRANFNGVDVLVVGVATDTDSD